MWSLFSAFYVLSHKIVLIGKNIFGRSGFFFKKRVKIPIGKIQGIIHSSFLRFNRLYLITTASKTKSKLFSVFTTRKNCNKIINKIYSLGEIEKVYSISFAKTLLMCVTWSDALTGLIVFYPFIQKIELLFGEEYKNKVYSNIDVSGNISSVGVPGEIASLAGIFILGWMTAIIIQFLRYACFTIYKNEKNIIIDRGLLIKNRYVTSEDCIVSVTVRQSLLMSLCRLKSIYINTIGLTLLKGDKGLLFMASSKDTVYNIKRLGLLADSKKIAVFKPVASAFASYLYLPFYFCLADSLLILFLKTNLKIISYFFLLIFIIWFLFRIKAYKNTALTFYDKAVRIDYFHRMNLTSTVISLQNIECIKIRQSIIQRFFNTCNVEIFLYSSGMQKQTVKHINFLSFFRFWTHCLSKSK